MNYEEFRVHVTAAINELPNQTAFLLKDLFKGTEWNELPRGDKLLFGKNFCKDVRENRIENVRWLGKAPNNSTQYIKE